MSAELESGEMCCAVLECDSTKIYQIPSSRLLDCQQIASVSHFLPIFNLK